MSVTQRDFNKLVRSFNHDYLDLLGRAAKGPADGQSLSLFTSVVDAYEVINKMEDLGNLDFEVSVLPLSLKCNPELLTSWGFSNEEIKNIEVFLERYSSEAIRVADRENDGF